MVDRRIHWRGVAILAVAAVGMAACSSSKSSSSVPASGSTSTSAAAGGSGNCNATIGFFGALTGPNSPNLGINERDGVKLAISQFNAANPSCKVQETDFDSQGDPSQAPALAQKAIEDSSVSVIIGPAFSGESKVADPIFEQGKLPNMTVSATGTALGTNGWKYWHRAVGNDNSQGPAAAQYLSTTLGAKKVAVIDDGSEYGKGIADIVRAKLKASGVTITDSESINPSGTDFSSTVNNIKATPPDAVFYGGYYQQAGIILKEMRDAGLTAKFMGPDGTEDPGLIKAAGAADAEGAILLAPGTPADKIPASFTSAYQSLNGQAPALYSVEAFDAANSVLQAIKAGDVTRAAIETYLSTVDYKGLSVEVKFSPTNNELASQVTIWASQVKGGQIVSLAPIAIPTS
jgi:branched-chain amino acid transport system substrate-binding protein